MEVYFNLNVNSFLDKLKGNQLYFWISVGCLSAIIILLIMLIIIKHSNKEHDHDNEFIDEKKLIKETLKENQKQENIMINNQKLPNEEISSVEVVEEEPKKISNAKPKVLSKKKENMNEDKIEPKQEEKTVSNTKVKASSKKEVVIEEVKKEKPVRIVNGKYEVLYDGSNYFYTLKASNGEILITSESYASKDSVLSAIDAIKRNIEVGTINIRSDKHGLYQFVLIAKNRRTLVHSANYPTEKRALAAAESFKRFGRTSPIVEKNDIVDSIKEEIIIDRVSDKQGGRLGVLNENGQYYFLLKASNGEILVHSTNYKTYLSAESAMLRFKEATLTGKFYVLKDKRGFYQFKLFSSNGRIVGVGEIYPTKNQAISSANSVCSFIKLAIPFENN